MTKPIPEGVLVELLKTAREREGEYVDACVGSTREAMTAAMSRLRAMAVLGGTPQVTLTVSLELDFRAGREASRVTCRGASFETHASHTLGNRPG